MLGTDKTITVNIIERLSHPNFNREFFSLYNNIALLKLERLIEFTPNIRPACLPTRSNFDDPVLVNWGLTAHLNFYTKLEKASENSILTFNTCNKLYRNKRGLQNGVDNKTQFCIESNDNIKCSVSDSYLPQHWGSGSST